MLTRSQVYNTLSRAFEDALGRGLVGASSRHEEGIPPNIQGTKVGSQALSLERSSPLGFHRFFYNQVLLRYSSLLDLVQLYGRCFCLPFPQTHQECCRKATRATFLKDLN